jgi:O-antigen ligase
VVDLALVAWFACAALQLLPLPAAARLTLSPAAVAVDRQLRLDAPADPLAMPARPLSIDPAGTVWALAVAAAMILVFWSARRVLAGRGPRLLIRAIAAMGLLASAVAVVQHATAPHLLYWYWSPVAADARPFSPFVNRNDLATWLIMAAPLVFGYLVARVRAADREAAAGRRWKPMVDDTGLWLGGSIGLMLGALLATTSRSGLTGGAAALVTLVWLFRGRMEQAGRGWLVAALVTILGVAAVYGNPAALAGRVGDTLRAGIGGRRAIWRETWPMVRDFWLTGVGAGAYERGMLVYQRSPRVFFFNHAHNEYLQLLAEGGVLLAVPAIVALVVAAALIVRRLRGDRTSFFWIRAGAASGLVGIAVQNVWETGLRVPANGVLFALLAAVATADVRASDADARGTCGTPPGAPDYPADVPGLDAPPPSRRTISPRASIVSASCSRSASRVARSTS